MVLKRFALASAKDGFCDLWQVRAAAAAAAVLLECQAGQSSSQLGGTLADTQAKGVFQLFQLLSLFVL